MSTKEILLGILIVLIFGVVPIIGFVGIILDIVKSWRRNRT
jgi:hypothetical protein